MSDASALRMLVNGAWQAMNTTLTWNGFTFTYAQILLLFIAVVIVCFIVNYFR